MEESTRLTDRGIYVVFNRDVEPEKMEIARSLEFKGYLVIKDKYPFALSLTRMGVEYCNKHQERFKSE
jgi:hypothetical protein